MTRKAEDAGRAHAPETPGEAPMTPAQLHARTTALWVGAFFDELVRCGVREAVISPGSRSTALAMAAFELSQRRPQDLRIYVDVDERGAAFFGLGLAKATGRPAAVICTSGTATANYYPAVIEAETSRVPLIVLTGDRPPRLQGLGAPQTTDQLNLYGNHVRAFRSMPLPSAEPRDLAFVRQAAREAVLAATGGNPQFVADAVWRQGGVAEKFGTEETAGGNATAGGTELGETCVASCGCAHLSGPVHLNFPFEEPLKPDFALADDALGDAFGGPARPPLSAFVPVRGALSGQVAREIIAALEGRRTLVLAGEGTCSTLAEAREVALWAQRAKIPVLADPLSGMRSVAAEAIVDAYDAVCGHDGCPLPEAIIRFGRWPISKRATVAFSKAQALNIVVDAGETRDFNAATDVFVPLAPLDFVRSLEAYGMPGDSRSSAALEEAATVPVSALEGGTVSADPLLEGETASAKPLLEGSASAASPVQEAFFKEWIDQNAATRARIATALDAADGAVDEPPFEGSIVRAVLDGAPAGSCVFAANSMSVRALDSVYACSEKPLCILANRGQNGIDGTLSTALGAAQHHAQTTFVTGDLTLIHDLNALALQHELREMQPQPAPSIIVVLLNNGGGAIFDMLPQASDDPYFERVFLTPQRIDFQKAAQAFDVPYARATSVAEFKELYCGQLGTAGISLIEVRTPLRGVKERYRECW